MLVYTCEQMRVIEENADVNGLSYVQMMEMPAIPVLTGFILS